MTEIVNDYDKMLNSIDKIIEMSPYKASYIIDKLGISSANYHRKKRGKAFTLTEMKTLAHIFDTDEMEDKLLAVYAEKCEQEQLA